MVIQQSMERISSFYHASVTAPRANHSDFFNTHACLHQLARVAPDTDSRQAYILDMRDWAISLIVIALVLLSHVPQRFWKEVSSMWKELRGD